MRSFIDKYDHLLLATLWHYEPGQGRKVRWTGDLYTRSREKAAGHFVGIMLCSYFDYALYNFIDVFQYSFHHQKEVRTELCGYVLSMSRLALD